MEIFLNVWVLAIVGVVWERSVYTVFFKFTYLKCQIPKLYALVLHIFPKTSTLHYNVIVPIQMQTDEDIHNTKFWWRRKLLFNVQTFSILQCQIPNIYLKKKKIESKEIYVFNAHTIHYCNSQDIVLFGSS